MRENDSSLKLNNNRNSSTKLAHTKVNKRSPHANRKLYLLVFLGGMCGAIVRSVISAMSINYSLMSTKLTLGTFLSNMIACFIFAMVSSLVVAACSSKRKTLYSYALGTGFCGGLSTMSTFALEGAVASMGTQGIFSILGMVFSFVFAIILTFIGIWIGDKIASCILSKRAKKSPDLRVRR